MDQKTSIHTTMVYGKRTSLHEAPTPVFRMPKWWPELARDAGIDVTREMALTCEAQRSEYTLLSLSAVHWLGCLEASISLPYEPTTFSSSDKNIPVSLRVPAVLPSLRAEELITWPVNKTFTTLPTQSSPQHVNLSKAYAIQSSKRLWEVKEILQIRIVRGRGMRARRAKRYLVRWTPSRLSAEELHHAQKT